MPCSLRFELGLADNALRCPPVSLALVTVPKQLINAHLRADSPGVQTTHPLCLADCS